MGEHKSADVITGARKKDSENWKIIIKDSLRIKNKNKKLINKTQL